MKKKKPKVKAVSMKVRHKKAWDLQSIIFARKRKENVLLVGTQKSGSINKQDILYMERIWTL